MRKAAELTYADPKHPLLKRVAIRTLERATGQRKLQRIYNVVVNEDRTKQSFWESVIDKLKVKLEYDPTQLAKIPREGPLVIIANHPYGVIDGLAICHIAQETRGGFKVIVNSMLCADPIIMEHSLPVDFAETKEAVATNIQTKRDALKLLNDGGTVVVFPAGGISTSDGFFGNAVDLEWKLFTARMIQATKATVVPLFFHGQNSRLFQMASQVSLTLRLSLIIREVNKQVGHNLRITIGDPIPYQELAGMKKKKELTEHLRQRTYALRDL